MDEKTIKVHCWMELGVLGLQKFTVCDQTACLIQIGHEEISRNVLLKQMERITQYVEMKVASDIQKMYHL